MIRIVPLGGQLADIPFGKIVVYRQITVLQVGKDFIPKVTRINNLFIVLFMT